MVHVINVLELVESDSNYNTNKLWVSIIILLP